MVARWSAVRLACAVLMAASSATYAGLVTGSGAERGTCVGLVMCTSDHVPAFESILAGFSGVSCSEKATSLLQLVTAIKTRRRIEEKVFIVLITVIVLWQN